MSLAHSDVMHWCHESTLTRFLYTSQRKTFKCMYPSPVCMAAAARCQDSPFLHPLSPQDLSHPSCKLAEPGCLVLIPGNAWVQAHREGCLCVICKQSRRSGRSWAGMAGSAGGRPASVGKPTLWLSSSGGAGNQPPMPIISAPRGAHLGPCMRFGKRAFVLATPHLLAGARGHQVSSVTLRDSVALKRAFC